MISADADELARIQALSYERAGVAVRSSWPLVQAMEADALAGFLDSKHFCVLATTRPDGHAQARPVAYTVARGAFWIATTGGGRLRNLRATPYASLVVMEGERGDHRMVLAEGPAELHKTTPPEVEPAAWAAAYVELRPELLFSYTRPGQ